jgi:hypothetical protein
MSLFTKILEKLGMKKNEPEAPAQSKPQSQPQSKPQAKPAATPANAKPAPSMPGSRPGTVANPAASSPATPRAAEAARAPAPEAVSEVDVVKKLETLSAGKGLNWKTSIVDLLKLLDLDSSREARTELAKELNAPADVMSDSARMNTWLHKEVLRRIAQNGGNIPKELLD